MYQPPTGRRPPNKWWYVIGGALIVLGVVGGITLFVVSLIQLTDHAPRDNQAFGNNEATTVHVDAGTAQSIYVTPADGNVNCTGRDVLDRQPPNLIPHASGLTLNHWQQLFTLTVPESGDYTISCSGPAGTRYGIAENVTGTQFAAPFIAAGVGAVVFGAGLLIIIVTAVRHISARPKPPLPQPWRP
jgi:hypothetical protein